ncbi:MAG: DUF1552 domain-containing protein [Polyangiales bacterium]
MKTYGNAEMLRRTFLAGLGVTSVGALLRPIIASAGGLPAPTRLLIVHRPCGIREDKWWPTATATTSSYTLSQTLKSFAALQGDMVVLKGVNCPRLQAWSGDKHGAGLMGMMSGLRPVFMPGTSAAEMADTNNKKLTAGEKTIDQVLVEKSPLFQGTPIPSLQLTAYSQSTQGANHATLSVMSYSGSNMPLWPEGIPQHAFDAIFKTTALGANGKSQKQSVLDFVNADLKRLRTQVPSSQFAKLDSHLDGIDRLRKKLTDTAKACAGPMIHASASGASDEALHPNNCQDMLAIIKTAFECDITRVATFTFAHGNSGITFYKIINALNDHEGHHNISHSGSADAFTAQEAIDKFYCDRLAETLLDMKNTKDPFGSGESLLDNTLVVFMSECSEPNSHKIEDIPVLLFGGKNLKLKTGQFVKYTNALMPDVWSAITNAMGLKGYSMTVDKELNHTVSPVTGLFG